jgi:hypothetical protein
MYLFYPETGKARSLENQSLVLYYANYPREANRTLEDVDTYYRSNPALIVVKDPDAISPKRPLKYIQHEDEEIMRNTNNTSLRN